MIKHFINRAEAEQQLQAKGYKKISEGNWAKEEIRATIHRAAPLESPDGVAVVWSIVASMKAANNE